MSNTPTNLKYTKSDEWFDPASGKIGLTDFAQGQLSDIVFVEIETVGETLKKEEVFGTIEAVKTVSDMFMPVSGVILEMNPAIEDTPDAVNKDPYGKGWMIKIRIINPMEVNDLLTPEKYKTLVEA